jgi:hypothetical protein
MAIDQSTSGASDPRDGANSDDGVEALARSRAAMAGVTSWRMSMKQIDEAGFEVVDSRTEVVCPDRRRVTGTMWGQTIELIGIGGEQWTRRGNRWERFAVTEATPLCFDDASQQARAQAAPRQILGTDEFDALLASAEAVLQEATITKGVISQVDGVACQEWVVSFPAASEYRYRGYTACMGLSDHLPREMRFTSRRVTIRYSDWNAPISIDPPTLSAP